MKILYATPSFPFPPFDGERVRSYHLLQALSKHCDVHLVTFYEDPRELEGIPALQDLGLRVEVVPKPKSGSLPSLISLLSLRPNFVTRHASKAFLSKMREKLREGGFTALHLDGLPLASYAPKLADAVPRVVLDMRDAWSLLYERQLRRTRARGAWLKQWLKWRVVKRYEHRALRYPVRTVLLSTVDRAALAQDDPRAREVTPIPNGVDTTYFQPTPGHEVEFSLLFTGALDYAPNAEAVAFFAHEVLPLLRKRFPAVRLVVAGRNPPPSLQELASEHLSVTGFVPDMRPYFDRATVVVCPLLTGAGIKNKLLEAMAMGKATVATPIAVEGLPVVDGKHVLIRQTPAETADAIAGLLESREARQTMGAEARAFVEDRYSWDAAARAFEELYVAR